MKLITKISKERCPRAIRAISEAIERASVNGAGVAVFRGMFYERMSDDVWQVASEQSPNRQFENDWTDADFGFEPEPEASAAEVPAQWRNVLEIAERLAVGLREGRDMAAMSADARLLAGLARGEVARGAMAKPAAATVERRAFVRPIACWTERQAVVVARALVEAGIAFQHERDGNFAGSLDFMIEAANYGRACALAKAADSMWDAEPSPRTE